MLIRVPAVLADAGQWMEGGALRVRHGRIAAVVPLDDPRAKPLAGERVVELPTGFLRPGFVNAHAHLELGGLGGKLPGDSFPAWIRALLQARSNLGGDDFRSAVREGARRLLEGGTTTVGDIDSTGAASAVARETGLRFVVFREVLDAGDPRRIPSALREVQRALPRRKLVSEGLSPHAPYTTSPALLAACADLLRRRPVPVAVHWAETQEEEAYLRGEPSPFDQLLGPSPKRRGLDLLGAHGLLSPRTVLVHGNAPGRGDVSRVAAAGCTLVHCPGTHRFFARPPFPFRTWRRAGVPLALGTDSLASNEALDMAAEARAAVREGAGVRPEDALRWATVGGARALGLDGRVGRIAEGFEADLVWHASSVTSRSEALEAILAGEGVERVWVAGNVRTPEEAPGSVPRA